MKNRYSFRVLAVGSMLMVALTARGQQSATRPGGTDKDEQAQNAGQDEVPVVGQMMKMLTEKLGLTDEQQSRITPILQKLHDTQQKLVRTKSLSQDERLAKVRLQRNKANQQIRKVLTDDQKKMLAQYLQGPHPGMHGSLSGATAPTAAPQRN